jgi:AcrR family transcriptional regulator
VSTATYPTAAIEDADLIVPQGVAAPASMPAEVFDAAAESYLTGQRLDMQALARRLGVGRATLYRRAGNRERLLDEVVWWRSRHALVEALHHSEARTGVRRIVAFVGSVLRAVERDKSLRAFLEADPEVALRILTGARSTVQQGIAAALEQMIDLEVARGHFEADLDTPTLAYAIVRISEGFLYSDIIADQTPDIERAIRVIEALLQGLDTPRG